MEEVDREALSALVGTELGVSGWYEIDQQRVDDFADVTEDHQFIHVDPDKASETVFGGTIAHGFLTLSLLVHLCLGFVPRLKSRRLMLNYGFDRIRFVSPVKVGKRIRARGRLAEVAEKNPGQFLLALDVEIEIDGEDKPALVARWLSLHAVDAGF